MVGPSIEHIAEIRNRSRKRMLQVLVITLLFMMIEMAVGFFTKSLALLADAGHMLTDVGAISLGLIAFWFASKPATEGKTYGYYRSEILASFVNGFVLVAIAFSIIASAWSRLKETPIIEPIPVFCVAFIGLLVNLFCLNLLEHGHGHTEKSLNVKAASLEVYGDALMSVGVMISSLIIFFFHWYQADAIASLVIGIFILVRTWSLLKECTNILMEGTPEHVDLAAVKRRILSAEGVIDAHDIHVWTITSGLYAMSAHVTIDEEVAVDAVLDAVTKLLQSEFNLKHTTIQIEQASCQTDACS